MNKHVIKECYAKVVWEWLTTRGGVAIWRSCDLCDPCKSWTTPVNNEQGQPVAKPSWQAESRPARIINDPRDIVVSVDKEVRRFRVAVRMGASGTRIKVTEASTRRLRAAVAKAGPGAYHEFDYVSQQAVIYAPTYQYTLDAWARGLETKVYHIVDSQREEKGDDNA